jgi:serine/threonine protein kinase
MGERGEYDSRAADKGHTVMERTRFLQHYRVRVRSDGSPYELDRNGTATTYEAVDERTGEPVSLKLIPTENIDPGIRQQFEEQMSAAQKLRHVNIAKVFDFGREGGDFVYVSEHLPGDTLSAWVHTHGPMRADAALRVAEQIVSVLSSASFHKLPFPSIQPADVMIVPGQTPEGSWPLVKLTNFGLPALRSGSEVQPKNSDTGEQALSAEQLATARGDIRSEIYSLGATLYFLLTGITLSAEALQAGPRLSRFPKPLRTLLGRMLHRDPDQRPKDLVVLAEMIRQCLLKIEHRRALADKYGIPFGATVPQPVQSGPGRWIRAALAVGALLLIAAVLAPVLLPGPIGRIMHPNRETKNIGVLVGVPENSPPATVQTDSTTTAPATVASQSANATAPGANQPTMNAATDSNASEAELHDRQQTQTANAQPQPTGPTASEMSSPGAVADSSSSSANEAKPVSKPEGAEQSAMAGQSSSQTKKKSVASASRRARRSQPMPEWTQRGTRSVRARVVGITSDGRLILRLPSGRSAIVAPDSGQGEFVPRRHRRADIDRDEMFAPPPQFEPNYFPYD